MTNYTKAVDFAAKDSLTTGNSAKIVKGTEIDTEFNAISTAIATKSNIAGPTFTGTVTIPTATISTVIVPDASDGASIGSSSLEFSDIYLADGALIYLGDDQDTTLTHVADTGILLNSTRQLQFGDSGTYIHQSADGVLDLVADTEIEINATTIDINGAADVSGNLAVGGNLTVTGNATIAGNLTFGDAASDTVAFTADVASSLLPSADNSYDLGASGSEWKDLFLDGTAHIDTLDIDENATIAGTLAVTGVISPTTHIDMPDSANIKLGAADDLQMYHDGSHSYLTNATGTMKIATETSGIAVTIGHTTSETTVADNLTVTGNTSIGGNLTVTGTTSFSGNQTFGNAASDTVTFSADIASDLLPSADGTHDLGASGAEWENLFIDGTANIDSLVADTADINGGTIDGAVIGGASAAAGTFTDLTSTGTSTYATVDINGGAIDGTVIGANSAAAGTFTTISGTVVTASTSLKTPLIEYTDGDDAITIADGGGVTIADLTATTADINGGTVDGTVIGGSSAAAGTFAAITGTTGTFSSNVSISTADNTTQLALISTDADANTGPILELYRNSSSPADNDELGRIYFYGENDNDEKIEYALIRGSISDVSDSSEDSSLQIYTYTGGAQKNRIDLYPTETAFNEGSADIDFRVESNGNANMLFVDAGNDRVGIGTASPAAAKFSGSATGVLNISGTMPVIAITESDVSDAEIYMGMTGGTGYIGKSGSGSLNFQTGATSTATAVTIDNNGKVGIGTITPGSYNANADDLVIFDDNVHAGITIAGGTNDYGNIYFAQGTSGSDQYRGYIQYGHSATSDANYRDMMVFGTATLERLKISGAGNVGIGTAPEHLYSAYRSLEIGRSGVLSSNMSADDFGVGNNFYLDASGSYKAKDTETAALLYFDNGHSAFYRAASTTADATISWIKAVDIKTDGNVSVEDGNLSFASGHGIDFSATSDGTTATSELLDDYEEGTWTPVLISGGSTNPTGGGALSPYGSYTKVGNRVTVTFYVGRSWTNTPAGQIFVSGLPFVIENVNGNTTYTYAAVYNINFGGGMTMVVPDRNAQTFNLYAVNNSSDWTAIDWTTHTTSPIYLSGQFSYTV